MVSLLVVLIWLEKGGLMAWDVFSCKDLSLSCFCKQDNRLPFHSHASPQCTALHQRERVCECNCENNVRRSRVFMNAGSCQLTSNNSSFDGLASSFLLSSAAVVNAAEGIFVVGVVCQTRGGEEVRRWNCGRYKLSVCSLQGRVSRVALYLLERGDGL